MGRIFAFEGENNRTLEWIPLDVRRKLDLAGAKLSLAAWQQMSREQREALVSSDIASASDVERFHALAVKLGNEVGGKIEEIAPVAFETRPWATEAAFRELEAYARALSIGIDPVRFRALDDSGKYALIRLANKRKSEDKFRAAVSELGVELKG